jgi:hypothetical protein
VIGKNEQSAAFVYGAYSFLDKLTNGIILFFITANCINDEVALKWIITLIPIICSLGAFGLTYIGKKYYSGKMAKLSIGDTLKSKSSISR